MSAVGLEFLVKWQWRIGGLDSTIVMESDGHFEITTKLLIITVYNSYTYII